MVRKACYFLATLLLTIFWGCTRDIPSHVENAEEAQTLLNQQRKELLKQIDDQISPKAINELIAVGLWEEAEAYLDDEDISGQSFQIAKARLLIKQHRYAKAERIVTQLLQDHPKNKEVRLQQAELAIQAWRLEKADCIAKDILGDSPEDTEAGLIRGRILLLNRNYDLAIEWAKRLQAWDANFAGGYWLESEAHFWSQDPAKAETLLRKALSIDPFYADARFSYGYAIWRRVDATQLDDMAAQWNLALEVNPLHYLTHWHFGNGHTNLTYADYTHPTDSTVQSSLDDSEGLIASDDIAEAIEVTRSVEEEYPESILPAMTRGSIYYMAYDRDRNTRLDSAQAIFEGVLEKKQNYGPAHNGLAAVIKQRQFEQLDEFEALEDSIHQTSVPSSGSVFYDVFPDAQYYPGDRVKKMIARQIGPSKAYLPMINKFGSDFAIPPLHIDLAEAMGNNYFRYGTTFDNRQWMDIRGVGSGATGIEYLERGAHLERNVLAHEYAHLYHGRILTDHESRRIRSLYHQSMKNDHTLDYYASNNESEFFAQGYAGFLSEEKVHPLNHKSMNTREYIKEKDPDFYTFLDSLLNKQQEYLSGNEEVFDNNWAQTHVSLAQQSEGAGSATAHLDTALSYSSDYLPALLKYAEVQAEQELFEKAGQKLDKAKELDPNYAPIYITEAQVLHQKALQGVLGFDDARDEQITLFKKAERLEKDLAKRAELNTIQRRHYRQYGQIDKAIAVAKKYVDEGPAISTYLRDRIEEAEADYHAMRSSIGYSFEAIEFFKPLVDQNPQNFEYRLQYGDALIEAGQLDKAESVIKEGQRILDSADNERADYKLRRAQIEVLSQDYEQAGQFLDRVEIDDLTLEDQLLTAQLYIAMEEQNKATEIIDKVEVVLPLEQGALYFVEGLLAQKKGDTDNAATAFKKALSKNPYHLEARVKLIALFEKQGNEAEKSELTDTVEQLDIALGPDFKREI